MYVCISSFSCVVTRRRTWLEGIGDNAQRGFPFPFLPVSCAPYYSIPTSVLVFVESVFAPLII